MMRTLVAAAVASGRETRQIVSVGVGAGVSQNAAGATTIDVPYPTTAAAVAANCVTFLHVALKPGTANLGAIATPAGWTKLGEAIGGGYGAALAFNTGNSRVALFAKVGDNSISGNVTVGLTPSGANGVASAVMNRIEKLKGTWQAVVTATGEATVDTNIGSYIPSALKVSRGDCLIYSFGQSQTFVGGTSLNAGAAADIQGWTPSLAANNGSNNGYGISVVCTGRRIKRGAAALGEQLHTIPVGSFCRGPILIARYRVR